MNFKAIRQDVTDLSETGGDTIVSGLHGHPSLRSVELRYTFKNEGTTSIVNLLQQNQILEKLTVKCQNIFGLCDVVDALGTNTTLKDLTVFIEQGGNEEVWQGGHRRLGALLARLQNLKTLNVHWKGNGAAPEVEPILPDLVRGLERNHSLTSVRIDYLEDGSEATKAIDFFTTRNAFAPALS